MKTGLEILMENENYLVINKAAGLNVERLAYIQDSVEGRVEDYLRQTGVKKPFAGIVHRLDRPVTGVLLIARKKSILKQLNEQFRLKTIRKEYHAGVCPGPDTQNGVLKHWLIKDQKRKRAWAYDHPVEGAQEAALTFEKIKGLGAGVVLRILPTGGKFHQIRVQLSAAGWPILGDHKYGASEPYRIDTIALHAAVLAFEDPISGAKIEVSAPCPF